MTHITTTIEGHTVTITGPDAAAMAEKIAPLGQRRTVSHLQKTRLTTRSECNAYLGHATGLLLAGGIECIVITADRDSAQAFIDQFNAKNGHSRFSTPVAMVQLKDVAISTPTTQPS